MIDISGGYMSVRLELYRIFDCVAQELSFSKAAKLLFMSQPAVSQAIMQLEETLEIRLFTRTARGVILTDEGELLQEYIHSAISLIEKGEDKIKETKELMRGELKIGVGDTISRYYLLPYLEKFNKEYHHIKLKIINRTTQELCQLIKMGAIDIAICNLPVRDKALEIQPCKEIQDIMVCSPVYYEKHLQGKAEAKILQQPLIALDSRSKTRQYVESYFLSKGINFQPDIELGSHDLILEFAKIGLGVACVIREFSRKFLEEGSLIELTLAENIPKRGIGICTLKGMTLSPASQKFLEYLQCDIG